MRTSNRNYYIKTWLANWGWIRSGGDEFDSMDDALEAYNVYMATGIRCQICDRDTDEVLLSSDDEDEKEA